MRKISSRLLALTAAAAAQTLAACTTPGGGGATYRATTDLAAAGQDCAGIRAEELRLIDHYNRRELQYWGLVKTIERVQLERDLDVLGRRAREQGCSP